MLIGMREGERFVQRVIPMERETRGYSGVYFTTDSMEVSLEFGLRLLEQPSESARQKLKLAKTFLPTSHESTKVVSYFCSIALDSGWFVALPYDEMTEATSGHITQDDINKAVEEGYIQVESYPGHSQQLVEVTTKLSDLVNPNLSNII